MCRARCPSYIAKRCINLRGKVTTRTFFNLSKKDTLLRCPPDGPMRPQVVPVSGPGVLSFWDRLHRPTDRRPCFTSSILPAGVGRRRKFLDPVPLISSDNFQRIG